MKLSFVLFFGLLATGAQRKDVPSGGEEFRLKIDATARVDEADLSLTFRDVKRDSRCPKGVQCIVAGEAVVVLEATHGNETTMLTFEIPPGGTDEKQLGELKIELTELEPEPVSGKRMERSRYVATVVVDKRSSSNPDIP